ncbi:MAG: hypothetical protein ACRDNF_10135, partial [Streptosporangiaceae bacterium]
LYDLLAKSVAPLFYDRDDDGLPRRWLEMVRHTLRTLGPRLQASRMVREYVTELYVPGARSVRALAGGDAQAPFAGARDLAAWRERVVKAWPGVRIEHVEAEALEPRLGSRLSVRASIALGDLTPGDVAVELVCGRAGEDDEITEPSYTTLRADPQHAGCRGGAVGRVSGQERAVGRVFGQESTVRYAGEAELGRSGPFGYTVRVLPSHPLLSSRAELGLVTMPEAPVGMTNGDLR